MFLSRSPIGINLQKKPEYEGRLNSLIWKLCLLPELPPSCQTSVHIFWRVFSFFCMIFDNMPFSQCHHFICLIHFGMLVSTALVIVWECWSLIVLKACKIENWDLGGSRVLLLKGMLCFVLLEILHSFPHREELSWPKYFLKFLKNYLIQFIGVTLICKTIQVPSPQLNKTSSAHCIVRPSLQAKFLSIPLFHPICTPQFH